MTDAEAEHARLDAQRKYARDAAAVDLNRRIREARHTEPALTALEHQVIAAGRTAPKTWDEINSTKTGGRDHGRHGP